MKKNGTSWLQNNGYSLEEEIKIYDEQLQDILINTRYYLDNLSYLPEYRVRWKNYKYKTPTTPYQFINKPYPIINTEEQE